MPEMLILEQVHLDAGEGDALFHDLSWKLPRGARTRIQGDSTTICSTFLQLCAGMLPIVSGDVILDGISLPPLVFSHPFHARGALGWLPTEGGLLANLSLSANVALPLRFTRGIQKEEAETKADEALQQAGLGHCNARRPHNLAPQERWLGAMVRAALLEPAFWIVDQPPHILDAGTRDAARVLFKKAMANPSVSALLADDGRWLLDAPWPSSRITRGHMQDGGDS